ncbi:formin-like protein 14, partial [Limulus polyphemus]|uniref:Formin-like protein 14 n=1 Tax=Limulus polyphemus TaxID=6850 RepID=A0ABM1C3E6_LIMPO
IKTTNGSQQSSPDKPTIPVGLSGLFAQGMPKLRPTGVRPQTTNGFINRGPLIPPKTIINSPPTTQPPEISQSHSSPPSPKSSSWRNVDNNCPKVLEQNKKVLQNNGFSSSRGPPPAPPSPSQKPVPRTLDQRHSRTGPPVPNKPPGLMRSASMTSLGPKGSRKPPPLVKPPPPPKSSSLIQNYKPPHKPGNVPRRQSFDASDVQTASSPSVQYTSSTLKPPQTLPTKLSQRTPNTVEEISYHITLKPKANLSLSPSQPVLPVRNVSLLQTNNVWPSSSPPPPPVRCHPPPPHCVTTLSQLKVPLSPHPSETLLPPPPPARHSSVTVSQPTVVSFEAKFIDKFHCQKELPPPCSFKNITKSYPSK